MQTFLLKADLIRLRAEFPEWEKNKNVSFVIEYLAEVCRYKNAQKRLDDGMVLGSAAMFFKTEFTRRASEEWVRAKRFADKLGPAHTKLKTYVDEHKI